MNINQVVASPPRPAPPPSPRALQSPYFHIMHIFAPHARSFLVLGQDLFCLVAGFSLHAPPIIAVKTRGNSGAGRPTALGALRGAALGSPRLPADNEAVLERLINVTETPNLYRFIHSLLHTSPSNALPGTQDRPIHPLTPATPSNALPQQTGPAAPCSRFSSFQSSLPCTFVLSQVLPSPSTLLVPLSLFHSSFLLLSALSLFLSSSASPSLVRPSLPLSSPSPPHGASVRRAIHRIMGGAASRT